jgi:TPR repeat protein
VSNFRSKLTSFVAVLVCLQVSLAAAQESVGHRGVPIDIKRLEVQDHANRVYERADYERAFFIFRNELAKMGDKYGQYMVGYMYLTGKGVDEDRVVASAWYRLAAERGVEQYVAVSDQLWLSFDAAQQSRSDQLFVQLRKQFGDLALVLQATRDDYDLLRSRTGSRLGASSAPLESIDPNNIMAPRLGVDYYDQIEKRIQARLTFIAVYTGIEIAADNPRRVNMTRLRRQVDEFLDELD